MKKSVMLAMLAFTAISCVRVVEVERKTKVVPPPRFTSPSRFMDVYEIRDTKGSNDFILVVTSRGATMQPISRTQ